MTRNGHTYRVLDHTPGGDDFWTRFAASTWEPELDDVLASHLDPDRTLIDIGAWIGPVTLMGSRLAQYVHAYEPDQVAARLLRENLALNHVRNVTVHPFAVGPVWGPGHLDLGIRDGGEWGDSMTSCLHTHEPRRVQAVPALHLTAGHGNVGLVKIDIEGGELDLVTSSAPILAGIGPLLLSVHAPLFPYPDAYRAHMTAALDAVYRCEFVTGSWGDFGVLLAEPR